MGATEVGELRDIGELLAHLKEPEPPKGVRDAGRLLQLAKALWTMRPVRVADAPCREVVLQGEEIDLASLPVQVCWPGDAGPLITWGLVITRGPQGAAGARARQNLGIYRQQVIGRRQVVMRWLAHRGGALDFREFAAARPGQPFPLAVALGADPATILGAVTPVPDSLSEYQFAGLLRGGRTEVSDCSVGDAGVMLQAPATAEFVLEGHIPPAAAGFASTSEHGVPIKEIGGYLHALEGPFGDHTGYYNEADWFPVFEIARLTHRRDPIYHSTYTGKPPDEPSVLGVALNEVFVPILRKQFPEIIDFYLPPEGCSYRLAIVSIAKRYPGHAKRVMFGIWSFLRQFMYTKFIVVTDDDVEHPRLERRGLGDHDPDGPGSRHRARRSHADRFPRFRLAGLRPRRQDGAGCDEQVARRDRARMGPADRAGRGVQARIAAIVAAIGAACLSRTQRRVRRVARLAPAGGPRRLAVDARQRRRRRLPSGPPTCRSGRR